MSYRTGPKIVTDGLVLCLDAADRNSYPGSGTVWGDLSGNGNNGTLVNGVTYGGDNYGFMSFDGSNDYIQIPYDSSFEFCNSNNDFPFSFSVWCYINSLTNSFFLHNKGDSGNGTQQSYAAFVSTSGNFRFTLYDQSGPNQSRVETVLTVQTSSWVNLSGTYSGTGGNTGIKLYINAVLQSTTLYTNGTYIRMRPHSTGLFLGSFGNTGTFKSIQSNGKYGSYVFYNKELTSQEVLQNYNATKGRFGL